MMDAIKTKKGLLAMVAGLTIASGFAGTMPTNVHAEESNDSSKAPGINKISVTISDDGDVTYVGDLKDKSAGKSWSDLIAKYRFFIAGIAGIGAVSMILFFIINFMRLGATSGNPTERHKAISGLIYSGLAAAGLGAVTFIVGIFFNAI